MSTEPIVTITQTSYGCPEIIEVHEDGLEVGYLRLRHGVLRMSGLRPSFERSMPPLETDPDLEPEEMDHIGVDADGVFASSDQRMAYVALLLRLCDIDEETIAELVQDDPYFAEVKM